MRIVCLLFKLFMFFYSGNIFITNTFQKVLKFVIHVQHHLPTLHGVMEHNILQHLSKRTSMVHSNLPGRESVA